MHHSEFATARPQDRTVALDARFERIFQEYQQPIASYLLRLVDDPRQAEELAQEAFLKAYRALEALPADANVRAWLYRIATNTAYDALRRRRLLKWLPLGRHPYRETSVSQTLEARIAERDAVRRALAELPPLYRVPLVLYTVEGFSTQEIAEVLHVSPNTVKVRIFRARQMFQQAYEEDSR
ncbi:MAG: RNA polymerase sigma factor [Anaerolineae bacterium]